MFWTVTLIVPSASGDELHFFSRQIQWIPFCGITEYLCGLVSVYECLIIAGVRVLIVYSTFGSKKVYIKQKYITDYVQVNTSLVSNELTNY